MRSSLLVLAMMLLTGTALIAAPVPDAALLSAYDADGDRLSDALETSLDELAAAGKADLPLRFMALLSGPPEDGDAEIVGRFDGVITHRFHRVIHGVAGEAPAASLRAMAQTWDRKLVLLDLDAVIEGGMDTTLPQTRARPLVWDPIPQGHGLEGDPGTTIAILDTGIDDSHPDLAGRIYFWHDFHDEDHPEPVDYNSHGTFVAGIACGTGAALGTDPITHLTHTESGAFYPAMDYFLGNHIPVVGDGQVTLDLVWDPVRPVCIDFGPPGGPFSGPYCSSAGFLIRSFTIDEPGYYVNEFISQFTIGIAESCLLMTTPYAQLGDGYPLFRGMAPGCRIAGFKVMNREGSGTGFASAAVAAMDSLVDVNASLGIKIANMSAGGANSAGLRLAAENVAAGGTVFCVSAMNNFPGLIMDPARAAKVITVGAVNDLGNLTLYSAMGAGGHPVKPDVVAPGGSGPPTAGMLGVDSNDSEWYDTTFFPDRVPDDYCNFTYGTSYASPHVAGLAALVVQALERTGYVWSYAQDDALLVKSLILMTATETNLPREDNVYPQFEPTLDRGGKDRFEGYGMINADAAVEAVLDAWPGPVRTSPVSVAFGSEPADRRCWAATLDTPADTLNLEMAVASTLDADIYIWKTDFTDGEPELAASSIGAGLGMDEALVFVPEPEERYYVTVKRIDGHGDVSLNAWATAAPDGVLPRAHLVGVYPNPFNPRTTVSFETAGDGEITVAVYDLAGRLVRVLEDRVFPVGRHSVVWDGRDERGLGVASGTYFVRMQSDDEVENRKVVLVR